MLAINISGILCNCLPVQVSFVMLWFSPAFHPLFTSSHNRCVYQECIAFSMYTDPLSLEVVQPSHAHTLVLEGNFRPMAHCSMYLKWLNWWLSEDFSPWHIMDLALWSVDERSGWFSLLQSLTYPLSSHPLPLTSSGNTGSSTRRRHHLIWKLQPYR